MSRPLRVGIIGCGNVALNFHLPAYQAIPDRYELVALADPTPQRLELGRVAAGLADDQVHLQPADLLARSDIDVVDICTPQHLHRDLIIAAAGAGKHILSEKPIAAVPADAAAAVAAAETAGVVLAVVHNYLFFPEVRAAAEILAAGTIGDVVTVTVNMLGVVDSPGATGYRPLWRKDPAIAGGGVLMDMLHAVYLAEFLLGASIDRVSAMVDAAEGDAVESIALCRLEAVRSAALVNVGWGHGPGGISITGTKGRVVIDYADGGTPPWAPFDRLVVTTAQGSTVAELAPGQELVPLIAGAMTATVLDLADAIENGRQPAANGSAALRTLELTVAAYASAAIGRNVAVPLPTDAALHQSGVMGLRDLDVPADSAVRRHGLFGLTPSEDRI